MAVGVRRGAIKSPAGAGRTSFRAAVSPSLRSCFGVMAVVATLAKGRQIEQPCGLGTVVVHVSAGQDDARPGDGVRLVIFRAAPLASVPGAEKPNKPAAQRPIGRIPRTVFRTDGHSSTDAR